MLEPMDLLAHVDLETLTVNQAFEQIWHLATGARSGMSPDYYMQRLGAIEILVGIAVDQLPREEAEE
jgi:hypothetical protein